MTKQDVSWINVLIVDDSHAILKYVSTVLEEVYGISQTQEASCASEALHILRQTKQINLIFLDLNMPNTDGIQLLEKISQLNYNGYIVIMSGISTRIISSVEALTKKYNLNHIGTLVKPMHETDFKKIIKKIGQSRKKRPAGSSLKTYEIVRALKNDDIEVFYQPQVELSSKTFIGLEALCRLNHPSLGIISPDRFIGLAEESELISHITMCVLKKSLSDWKKWHQYGLDIKLAVNISPNLLDQPEFADLILNLIEQYDMPANMLCLEVTETVLADDQTQELMNLNRLSIRGVEIALDDFGELHATIDRLQKLPLSYLKLDKSCFIDNKDQVGQLSLLNTSLSMAEKLKIRTIAEGLETSSALQLASEIGCDYGQGYFIARPMLAKEVLPWHRQWSLAT
ncbi:EAL domain-containing protein [Psychrobium sp. 1_MG-2023]|uniref:EAL domain-containing response regulator n=1 Tax=Psychrobium sp. 1_MG-2023 TaxID=3062624 RepID=UPI00267AE229|nr:EAL domain-containing response regulator [Psychrobium sp. 1_MG-2023]MDP2561447.1 EAL domain-containing response regulator [Psychrobium sp. 1_MG-2023]